MCQLRGLLSAIGAPTPSFHFLPKPSETVKRFICQTLQFSLGPGKGWEEMPPSPIRRHWFLQFFRKFGVCDGPDRISYT